jgi:hypothetical protein
MSKRTRALILGATLAAMNLAGLTAVAHAQATNEAKDARQPPAERQVGETWRHGQAASPEQAAADAASSGRWPGSATRFPAGHPPRCPPQCPPSRAGHPAGWSLPWVSWLLRLRSPVGWPCWPPGEPAAGLGLGPRPDQESRSRRSMGLPRPPAAPSPCRRRIGPLACPAAAVSWSGGNVRTHYLTLYGRERPAKTQGCIAVSPRLLIRMRPLVQVQPGPPHRR